MAGLRSVLVFEYNIAERKELVSESPESHHLANHVQGMNDTRKPTQDCQTDVDQEISTTSSLKEDTQRGQDDRKNDLADIPMIPRTYPKTAPACQDQVMRAFV
ncbi:hypothetical protein BO83DRAFT_402315 [Aspergillus eucalypticola CBS 122712]|uniref:Uncharacterized protein n=1 Tax=Aspergillus eucalypticola (strain CBS 122712 / IBT 29274) TaxID=1448314 RepID=A0A317UTE8_ASPEC|nr:uncharacterized protein BO83DRAFT_402315 [Aspergillus eucalypticola CBS 122712]PWY64576.1 hypothetical protein BO83DRAFT_402315 [Aspergillus eucalypticola CBS 122712]